MSNRKLNILSYNVNGLGVLASSKFNKLLSHFVFPYQSNSQDIICFQGIKLNSNTIIKAIKKLSQYNVYYTLDPGTSSHAKAGILIAIKKAINIRVLDKKINKGWSLALKCRMNEKVFVLASIYMDPTTPQSQLSSRLANLDAHLKHFHCKHILLIGNFNCTFSEMDNSIRQKPYHKSASTKWESFFEKWGLQDMWRLHNPNTRRFTHRGSQLTPDSPIRNLARIDHVFVSLSFLGGLSLHLNHLIA